ncbi:MAG TPA: hypothetical protein VF032_19495 [Thermoleophilaceae bacterium]
MAHPLFDRRDLTAARDVGVATPAGVDVGAELLALTRRLDALLLQERTTIEQLCISDIEAQEQCMENFPLRGAKRYIVRRTGNGESVALVANTPTLLVPPNENRLGGIIVVSGAGAVTLALTRDVLEPGGGTPLTVGVPQLFLAANGGSWDFKLSDLLWCGSITAIAAANTTVTVAEV